MSIKFYSTHSEYGCFSNFSRHAVRIYGEWWNTSEHAFQAQKRRDIEDNKYYNEIRKAKGPMQAATMGRDRSIPIVPNWDKIKDQIMYDIVLAKFSGNEQIKKILLSTGDEDIIEDSPTDYYWGCGADGS